jgi:hypothetical protein
MKFTIEVCGHTPKQKVMIERMVKEFVNDLPERISISLVKFEVVGGKKDGKQISRKKE